MKPILEIKSISKKYAIHKNQPRYRTLRDSLAACFRDRQGMQEFWALENLSFNILPGEKWGIIGENGAGKTTLLKIIAKITPPTKGSILVRGRVASLLEVGTGFHPELTGRENIFLNGAILGLSRREILNRFDQIVDFAEIEKFLDTPVKHYSTGMWARLAFSVAAHLDPEILLIDEVLSVGDADFQSKSLGKMNEVSRQGRTILFVSHNMAAVRQLCTHCVWISKGEIKLIGTPDEVMGAYRSSNESNEQGFAESASFAHRRGSQDVCLRRIELRNQHGEMTGVYAIGDDLHIHLFIEPSVAFKKVKMIVSILESNGDCVCTMYDNDSGFSLRDISRPRHVSLNLADLRFCPGQYAREMLASVHAQSFPDYEVIIVNDGSTDGTKNILDNLHHEKLTVIHTQNHGPAAARNTAIAATKAPLILNLDADDKIAPSLLEKAFAVFSTRPDLGIVHSEVQFFGARSGRFELPPYSLPAMLQDNIIHSTALFRKEDWKAVGGYSDELIYGLEDYDLWLSIIELGRGIYKIPEDLIFYRTYKNLGDCRSGKVKKSRRKIMRAQLTIFRRHEQLFKACPEECERMLKLKEVWEIEPLAVQWLKQVYYSLRHAIH